MVLHIAGLNDKLCRIELSPDFNTLMLDNKAGDDQGSLQSIYTTGNFKNWGPVLLKAQLQAVSTNIKNMVRPCLYEEIKSENFSTFLSAETLYIPKRLLIHFNAFTGKENENESSIFEGYHYKYRICTDEELYNIFEVENRGRFLFEYVKSSTFKFISIYDLKYKTAIYKKETDGSYNLKKQDIQKLK